MITVFVEYEVDEQLRENYLAVMARILKEKPGGELLESRDRPGLFLELWKIDGEKQADEFKQDRQGAGNDQWEQINRFVAGGRERIRIWLFQANGYA